MKHAHRLLAPVLVLSIFLTSCGGGGKQTGSKPPPVVSTAALNGSWLIVGSRSGASSPDLSISMGVVGNAIHGQASDGVTCKDGSSEGGFAEHMDGQIASDGSFEMTNPSAEPIQIAVHGQAPAAGATTWSGSYSFTGTIPGSSCVVSQTGNFNATPLPAVNATYTGTVVGLQSQPLTPSTVTLTMNQGSFTSANYAGTDYYYTPLTASFTASNALCFATATVVPNSDFPLQPVGQVMGWTTQLIFTTDTGLTIYALGYFDDATENTLEFEGSVYGGKNCTGSGFSGQLTRQ